MSLLLVAVMLRKKRAGGDAECRIASCWSRLQLVSDRALIVTMGPDHRTTGQPSHRNIFLPKVVQLSGSIPLVWIES